jgi:hypothetical protein
MISEAQKMDDSYENKFNSLIKFCQENRRVCPQPQRWQELYDLLPNKRRTGAGWEPPLPLILAAWWDTPNLSKVLRLRDHIEWAAKHGVLDDISAFLQALPEDQWFHGID